MMTVITEIHELAGALMNNGKLNEEPALKLNDQLGKFVGLAREDLDTDM